VADERVGQVDAGDPVGELRRALHASPVGWYVDLGSSSAWTRSGRPEFARRRGFSLASAITLST
jgi:hypothetical protein